jgi:hypothetical protein
MAYSAIKIRTKWYRQDLTTGRLQAVRDDGPDNPVPLIRRLGFSSVTTILGATLLVIQTLDPMTVFSPTTVSPPRIVALA